MASSPIHFMANRWVKCGNSVIFLGSKINADSDCSHKIKRCLLLVRKGMTNKPCFKKQKAMATHSSTLACKIPWTEELGRLQSMGSLRVRHD